MNNIIKFIFIPILLSGLMFAQKGISKVDKKPIEKKAETKESKNYVKPMKKKNVDKYNEFQSAKDKLRKEFEAEKLAIHEFYSKEIARLKEKRKSEIIQLKEEYKKKRDALKK